MTIGQKILQLRSDANISQEQLAETLGVSRQSVSKWEMDQALPQIDKVIQLSELFSVSTDALLRDNLDIKNGAAPIKRNKYFGTDGFRGEANINLTSIQAYKVVLFLKAFGMPEVGIQTQNSYRQGHKTLQLYA